MRKFLLLLLTGLFFGSVHGQQPSFWNLTNEASISKNLFQESNSQRPSAYKIYSLDVNSFRAAMRQAPSEDVVQVSQSNFIVSFPLPDGTTKAFRVVEAPSMEPELSAKFPGINSYSGQGIDDPSANVRFDVSQAGVHASIMSAKHSTVYIDELLDNYYRVVYRKDMTDFNGKFKCLTEDIPNPSIMAGDEVPQNADDGRLRKYKLAMISGGEFSLHFIPGPLPTTADSIAAVIAAQNSHVTRANQVYERDFGVRLLLVGNNNLIVYLDPLTDPISNPNNPNGATCQAAIDALIGNGNYDIGHTESKGSDNGNAGCIGCVCVSGSKGRGWTVYSNPSLLEFFVIDYLTHEIGHQFGANHTFSFNLEGSGVNVEPGSGVTIMGYAGIVAGQNVALHSIEVFSVKSIEQVTNYIKTGNGASCPVVDITGNIAPVVNAGSDYTIPVSTPFTLTGIASDANPGDVLTYNWEQIDNRTGAFPSIPVATATNGPMFRTYLDYPTPVRTFPELQYILTGANGFQWEVLPSVGRALNFRFIAKDNNIAGGNNKSDDMVVNTAAGIGPFTVTSPNTNVSWAGGSTQTITWNVAGSTGAPVSCANVKISLSTNGGLTFPTVILASTPNDGSEAVTIPTGASTTARIKIEAVGNIFFDISNTNFTITVPAANFTLNAPAPTAANCPAPASMQTTITATYNGGFVNNITLSATGNPGGTTVVFGTNPLTTITPSTTVTLTGTNTLANGAYIITVTGVASGAPNQTQNITYTINPGTGPVVTTHPSTQAVCQGGTVTFTVAATGALNYQWQKSTDGGANWNNIGGATGTSYTIVNVQLSDAAQYRCATIGQCNATNTNAAILTVNTIPAITAQPQSTTACVGGSASFSVTATGSGLTYIWQSAATCAGPWTNVPGGTSSILNVTPVSTTSYQCIVSGTCTPSVTSNCATMTVVSAVVITQQPSNATVCDGSNTSFTVAGAGAGLTYQWQVSTDGGTNYNNVNNGGVYSGATSATLNITGATFSLNNYRYRCQLSNGICPNPGISNPGILTVNTLPAIATSPSNATICVGSSNTFNASATGTGITYQWQVSTDGGANYSNIGGATSASYTLSGATIGMNNNRYRCVATGTCAPVATTSAAILTVIAPVSITGQPAASTSVCAGNNTSFTIAGSSVQTIVYQWQVSTDGGANYNNVNNGGVYSGATTATLSITGATLTLNNYRYRCLMSNATCAVPTVSNASILTVNALPVVTWTNALAEQCSNNTTFVLTGGTPAGGAYSGTGVTGTNFNASTAGAGLFTLTYTYTDVNGCVNSTTNAIRVRLQPTIGLAASLSSLLPGKISTLTATPSAGTGGTLTTNWFFNGTAITNSGNTRAVNVEQVGDYQVRIQEVWPSTLVCSNQSAIVTITATPSDNLFIFPSPNDGRFTVSYYNNGGASTKRTIAIFDTKGSNVYYRQFDISGAYTLIPIDLRTDNTGIYYVVVGDANGKKLATGKVHVR
jgi:hypothetical protein